MFEDFQTRCPTRWFLASGKALSMDNNASLSGRRDSGRRDSPVPPRSGCLSYLLLYDTSKVYVFSKAFFLCHRLEETVLTSSWLGLKKGLNKLEAFFQGSRRLYTSGIFMFLCFLFCLFLLYCGNLQTYAKGLPNRMTNVWISPIQFWWSHICQSWFIFTPISDDYF